MTHNPAEVVTYGGFVSTLDLEAMFEGGNANTPSRQVLLVGDLATSACMLLPVAKTLQEDFDVEKVYGLTFHQAMTFEDTLLRHLAQGSHFLGHGAAAIALANTNLNGLKSATVIAGPETQPVSNFIKTFYGLLRIDPQIIERTDRCRPDDTYDWDLHFKWLEILRHPLFTRSMLTIAAGISSLDLLAKAKVMYNVPAVSVSMEHDEYRPDPTKKMVERADEWGVVRRLVTGDEATHDFLLANPPLALTRAEFRTQI